MKNYATIKVACLCLASFFAIGIRDIYAQEVSGQDAWLWYASDASGMAFDTITGPRDAAYALKVSKSGSSERSELFHDGVVIKSWHRSFAEDGMLSREAFSEGDMLIEERLYDERGKLTIERLFLDEGVVEEIAYQYASGRLQSKTTNRSGETPERMVYMYAPDGRLASVNDTKDMSFGTSSAPSGGQAIWRQSQDGLELRRFGQDGRLSSVSVYIAGVLNSNESREWKDGALLRSVVDKKDGTRTTIVFAPDGAAIGQETNVTIEFDGTVQSRINRSYDFKGRLERMETIAKNHVQLVSYEYDQDDTLLSTKTLVDGFIESLVTYASPLVRIEELYSRGVAFVRVRYEDGRRVLEEMLKDGEVVRSKRFE